MLAHNADLNKMLPNHIGLHFLSVSSIERDVHNLHFKSKGR